MVLLALPPADHLLIERDRGQFVPSLRRRMMANARAERLLEIPGRTQPRAAYLRHCSSNASGLQGRNSVGSPKSTRLFKGIICDDVSEFESHMPSHAVRSLWLIYGTSKNARHSTRLARLKRAQPRAGAWRSPERSAPFRDRRRICWGMRCPSWSRPGRLRPRWGLGLRVPMVIVSPFAKKRFVDHTVCDTTIG